MAARENLVQRILKVGRRIGELLSDLIDILLEALLDLLAEEIFERAVTQTFVAPLRKVGDEVGDERTR